MVLWPFMVVAMWYCGTIECTTSFEQDFAWQIRWQNFLPMPSMEKQMSTMQKKWKQQFLWKISSSADRHFTYAAVYVDCVENKEWRRRGGRRESGFVVRRCVKKGWQQRYAGHHSCKLQQFSYACGCGFLSSRKMGEGKEILELNCPDLSRYSM